MKELRFRIFVVIFFFALSLYFLYPTYQDYANNKEINEVLLKEKENLKSTNESISDEEINSILTVIEDSLKNNDSYRKAREKRMKLGLDLQGGMRVVLEVNTAKLLEKIAKNPDEAFFKALNEAVDITSISEESVVEVFVERLTANQIRLSKYFGSIRQSDDEILSELQSQADDAVSRAMEIIRNRIDQYGVAEPSIQRQGNRRLIVELPGISNEEEARQLLQGTALLEFRLLRDPEFTFNIMEKIDQVLAGKTLDENKDTTKSESDTTLASNDTSTQNNEELSLEQWQKEHPFFALAMLDPQGRSADAYVLESNKTRLNNLLKRPEVQNIIPDNVEFLYSAKPIGYQDGQAVYHLYLVNKTPELTGGVIVNAVATLDPSTSTPIVNMEMNSEGAVDWARITGANIDKRCAIILDGVVFSAPVIRNKITGGRSVIEGMSDLQEAKLLEIVLKAGALPAPVDIIEERTVGPSLGQDSISQGLNSAMIGYLLVAVFMIFYYKRSGAIASAALIFTVLFVLGILAGFGATLTLPGIAGIILTIGMAVDANVLIFERVREEYSTGKTVKAAVESGFSKAYSAIFDSNITTFFTGVILYQFGTGPIQGFALTLMIGIVTSLFGALVITRLFFDYFVAKGAKLSIG